MDDRRTLRSIAAVALFALLSGCADDPTSVGLGLLPPGDLPVFRVDTLLAASHASVRATVNTATSDAFVANWYPRTLFLGGLNTLKAGAFVRFNAFPDSLTGISITAADLVLYDVSSVGDSAAPVSVTLHAGRGYWMGDSLMYDSLDQQAGRYFDPTPLPAGTGTGAVDSAAVTIPLDTALVRTWFISTVDTGSTNRGVFLEPTGTTSIRGFASFVHPSPTIRPKLRINYVLNGNPGTFTHQAGESRFVATIPQPDLVVDPANVYVQAGVAYHGMFTFDISNLPRSIAVNNAELEVTAEAGGFVTRTSIDTMFAFAVNSTGALVKGSPISSRTALENGRTVYRFPVGTFVTGWLRLNLPSSIVLSAYNEITSMDRFVLAGSSAGTLRPRLVITSSPIQLKTGRTKTVRP